MCLMLPNASTKACLDGNVTAVWFLSACDIKKLWGDAGKEKERVTDQISLFCSRTSQIVFFLNMKTQNPSDPVFSRHRNTELSADGF